jgi:hypothetical protein
MKKNIYLKKWLTIGVTILFFTIGFSSVINAQTTAKATIQKTDLPSHRLLLFLIGASAFFRDVRDIMLFFSSIKYVRESYVVTHPIIYYRCVWLAITTYIWLKLWIFISNKNGWGWGNILEQELPYLP